MSKKQKRRQSVEELLASCSNALFPAELGSKKVEITSRGSDGDTPLHVLLRRKNSIGAIALIEAGADVNAVGDMSETPLHLAVKNDDVLVAAALIARGADPDSPSEFDQTPRSLATNASREMRQLLER